jgi:hypothetical protein
MLGIRSLGLASTKRPGGALHGVSCGIDADGVSHNGARPFWESENCNLDYLPRPRRGRAQEDVIPW